MVLNWDILYQILSHLDRGDASRMSRTCRILCQAAPRFLLRGQVELHTGIQFSSFFKFILRHDKSNNLQYLRSLTLNIDALWHNIPRLSDQLVDLFSASTKLESLDINDAGFIEIDERILQALAALISLRKFEFRNPAKSMLDMLKTMQAPLTHVSAYFFDYDDPPNPVPIFVRFKDSLESMHAERVNLVSTEIQYPRLTSLSLVVDECNFARLQPIIQCFPNLQDLYIGITNINDDDLWDGDEDDYRSINLASQTHTSWTSLKALSGDIRSLYVLAVQCRVQDVEVLGLYLKEETSPYLPVIISDLHPSSLSVSVKVSEASLVDLRDSLGSVQDSLTQLELKLLFHGKVYEDLTSEIIAILKTLSAISLRSLCLELEWEEDLRPFHPLACDWSFQRQERADPPLDLPTPSTPFTLETTASIKDIDRCVLADQAMRCIPSLLSFTVTVPTLVPRIEETFEVVEENGGVDDAERPRKVVKVSRGL